MRDIVGYEGQYAVTKDGRVWSYKRNAFMRQQDHKGYRRVGLRSPGHRKLCLVHRLVAEAYIENVKGKAEVNHINSNRADNRVDNLEWVTRSENNQHAWDKGAKQFKMTDNFRARRKLTDEQAKNLVTDYKSGQVSQAELGRKYGIKQHSVWNIIHGATYAT